MRPTGEHASPERVLDCFLRALRSAEDERAAERAPVGIDSLDEVEIGDLLQSGCALAGWGCFREVFYPSVPHELRELQNAEPSERSRLPRDSERLRADLVLTPSPTRPPLDPLAHQRETRAAEGTLFADVARRHAGRPSEPDAGPCPPGDAAWIEVKCTGQIAYTDGVPRPNHRYAGEVVLGPALDLAKLARDRMIVHGMSVLVVFVRDEATAMHDLGVSAHRLLDRGLDLAPPVLGGFPITDRVGNGWCAVAMLPLRLASRLNG